MARCVIFCAGGFDRLMIPIESTDYIIAADGGFAHTQKLGISPHAVLGDFDSLGYAPEGASVFPSEKDDTDTMLSIRHGLSLGYKEFLIYGALDGSRPDHTVAALQSLLFLAQHNARGVLVGLTQNAAVLENQQAIFPGNPWGTLSVFAVNTEAKGVTLQGLKYPLTDGFLSPSFPLGVSNRFTGTSGSVSVTDGTVLLLWDRENGLPEIK